VTCGVYRITCRITGESYIGASSSIEVRWKAHLADLYRGSHYSRRLQLAYDKYGIGNLTFEVIRRCREMRTARKWERKMIGKEKPILNSAQVVDGKWFYPGRTQQIRDGWARSQHLRKRIL